MTPRTPSPHFIQSQINYAIDAAGAQVVLDNGYTNPDGTLPKAVKLTSDHELMKKLNIDGERNEKIFTGFQFKAVLLPYLSQGMGLSCLGDHYKVELLNQAPMDDTLLYVLAIAYQI